jgi:hypothetical protein
MSQITAIVQRIVMNADFNVSFYDRYNNLLLTLETATYAQVVNTYLICGDSDGNSIKFFVNEITSIEGPTFSQTYVPIVAGFYQQDQAYFNRLSEIYNYMETNVVNVVIRWIDALKFADGTTQTTAATGGGGSGTVTSVGFTAGTGISITGDNPITTSGNVTISSTIDPSVFVPYTGATTNVDLGEYELKAGQIEFDQTPTGTAGVAVMRWNDSDGTVDLGMKGGNVTLQIGQEQLTRVVNKTGSDLLEANYQAVKISGAQGNRLKVALAQANNDANSAETLGIVTETILNNQEGFVTTSGIVRGVDTTGSLQGETWADGDMLYLSGTVAGQLTNIKPTAPIHTVIMGYVVRAHAIQGQIYVKVDNGYELDELHNVAITTPANNDLLTYESSTSLWKNKQLTSSIVNTALGYVPTSPTDLTTALAAYQQLLTLTTIGTSGAATLVGNVLNIPQYGASNGFVSVYAKSTIPYSSVGTGSQIIHSLLIPANTFNAGDVLRFTARFKKVGTNASSAATIYINNALSLSGAKVVRSNPFAATTLANGMQASAVIINRTNLTQLPFTASSASDIGLSTGAWIDSTAIDWTAIQYILFSCNPSSALDIVSLISYQIEKL